MNELILELTEKWNGYPMSYTEIFAVVFTLLCVWLTVVRSVWCWPLGIIGVSLFFFVFLDSKLYGEMILQIVFLGQSIYGWYYWVYGDGKVEEEVPIKSLSMKELGLTVFTIGLLGVSVGFLLSSFTDGDVPYIDSLLASVSLVANMLLARKVLQNWPMWVLADIAYVGLFYYKGLFLTSGLYIIFFFMASYGWWTWRKAYRAQTETSINS